MGTVTVEMESRSAGPDGVYRPGDTRECSKSKAQSLVESGQASYIEEKDVEVDDEPEDEENEEEEETEEETNGEDYKDYSVDELIESGRVEQNGPYYILKDEEGEEIDSFHGREALEEHLNE